MRPSVLILESSTSNVDTSSRRPFVHFMGFVAPLTHVPPDEGALTTRYAKRTRHQHLSTHGAERRMAQRDSLAWAIGRRYHAKRRERRLVGM